MASAFKKWPNFSKLVMKWPIWQTWADSGLMGCCGGGLVLCSAWHVRCNSASFTHLQLMWTTLHPLNLCKNSFCDSVGVKSQNNEIWKSWSWSGNLNKTVVGIRSGLFKMCWILPDSSPEIQILYTSALRYAARKVIVLKQWDFNSCACERSSTVPLSFVSCRNVTGFVLL